jgi:hypothetical protein
MDLKITKFSIKYPNLLASKKWSEVKTSRNPTQGWSSGEQKRLQIECPSFGCLVTHSSNHPMTNNEPEVTQATIQWALHSLNEFRKIWKMVCTSDRNIRVKKLLSLSDQIRRRVIEGGLAELEKTQGWQTICWWATISSLNATVSDPTHYEYSSNKI